MNDATPRDDADITRRVVDRVPSMIAYWDRDLRCRFANRAYERWFGVDPDALLGSAIRDLLGPELYALNEPHLRAALRGEAQLFERVVPGPGGEQRHSLAHYLPDIVDGEVRGFVAYVTEVTRLKDTEAALRAEVAERTRAYELLRESEAALRDAQRLGQIGSWRWDLDTDIAVWSDELFVIFGLDPAQRHPPTREQHAALYTPESWARLRGALRGILRTGEPYAVELEFRHTSGRTGWLEARGEAVRDASGRIVRLRGTTHDITTRRQVEATRLQRDLAEAANRNKTQFLSRVSHELRTPLNAILGFAQLFDVDASVPARHREWAGHIRSSGAHMLELVEDILDLSAAELGRLNVRRDEVDLAALVRDALAQFGSLALQAGVQLADSVPAGAPLIALADARRVRQIINNLLSNALKYNHAGGRASVSAGRRGDHVWLAVQDTGPGMNAEQLARLYTPFDRLGAERSAVAGSGIGLALTHRLVEAMGGRIEVESRPGLGSTFTVQLPAAGAAAPPAGA